MIGTGARTWHYLTTYASQLPHCSHASLTIREGFAADFD